MFGRIRILPSGSYQARCSNKWVKDGKVYKPTKTFPTGGEAEEWLKLEEKLIYFNDWAPPAHREAEAKANKEAETLTVEKCFQDYLDRKERTCKNSTVLTSRKEKPQ